jgi:hypothetical protein
MVSGITVEGNWIRKGNWVKSEIIQALRQGYSASFATSNGEAWSEEACIQQQANALVHLIERVVTDADSFHLLIGFLNDLRLREVESEDAGESEDREDADG